MRIRKATLADSAEIARLHKGTIRNVNSADYSPEQIAAWSARTSARRFRSSHDLAVRYVAVEGEKIVGYADFKKEEPEKFWGLYVHKDHLGEGIGSRLLTRMEAVAKELGAKKFYLEATKTAKTFYEKNGFVLIRKSVHLIDNQKLDIYLMEKEFV